MHMSSPMHPRRTARTTASTRTVAVSLASCALAALAIGSAQAAPPPDVEAGLQKIGRVIDPICTARLYRPLMPSNDIASGVPQPYPGITVTRNQSFGPDPDDVVDVFAGDQGAVSRTVLIFVPGGVGNKTEIEDRADNAFYDNIGRWAAQNGMVGVLMQRKASPSWDGGARDVAAMLQWVEGHIDAYHGNPDRMFLWAHSAGNIPMSTYVGHPELYGPKGVGVKGVIFMSAAPFDIAPVKTPVTGFRDVIGNAGQACGVQGGMAVVMGSAGALPGVPPGRPGGPPAQRAGGPAGLGGGPPGEPPGGPPAGAPPPGGAPDAAAQLAHSNLPGLRKASFRMMIVNGTLDPPSLVQFGRELHDALCNAGPAHCPIRLLAQGEDHMSQVFSIDSPDTTVSAPVLAFIRRTR